MAYPFSSNVIVNPLNYLYQQSDIIKSNKVLANAAVTYKPIPDLSIRISGGIENSDDRTDNYTTNLFGRNSTSSNAAAGSASINTGSVTSLLNENIATYSKKFNDDHELTVTGGFTYQDFVSNSLSASGAGYISDVPGSADVGAGAIINTPNSDYSKWVLLSYLGRVNYTFKGKYLATVSFRSDGSSRYSEGNKWGYFPSAALAWRVSDEAFMKDIRFISDLKLRAGYGESGSTALSPYQTRNLLNSGKTVFDDALYTTYAPGTRLPADLKWETTAQSDFGMDLSFLNNRFRLTADYYIKTTRNLLNTVQLPSSLGYTNTLRNIGKIQNKGFEVALDAAVLDQGFKWNITTNFSINRNQVLELYNNQDILGEAVNVSAVNDNLNILREGHALGMFYGYVEEGYNEKGQVVYKDLNNDKLVNQLDKTFIGNPNPDFIYGLNSTMSFKNFDLNIFIQGSQGNDIFNLSAVNQTIDYGFGLNMPRDVYQNHWTPTNTTAKYPKISRTTAVRVSDRFVEDGSYLRLKNVQLAYNIPFTKLGIKAFRSGQVYVSGQNLFTLTDYSWYDPEINSLGGSNSIRQGVDYYSYPTAKTVTFGLRLGL